MSELREKIAAEGRRIWAYAESGATEKYPVPKGPAIDAATDRILALVAEAIEAEAPRLATTMDRVGPFGSIQAYKHGLQVVLAAAGITTTD